MSDLDLAEKFPNVAITGANGWLGRRVILALTEGLSGGLPRQMEPGRIHCLVPADQDATHLASHKVSILRGDIRDPEACKALMDAAGEGACVIHLAGIIHPPVRTAHFEAINATGSLNIFRAAHAAGAARMIALSSNSPFGANPSNESRFDEESPYRPYMGYGRSKYLMETMLRQDYRAHPDTGLLLIRAPWFYGPGQPPRQTEFFSMVRKGGFPLFGGGHNRRSMAYVDSLAQGILLAALRAPADGRAYWIADEMPYSMLEIVETVKAVMREDFGMTVSTSQLDLPRFIPDLARVIDRCLQGIGLYHQKIHVLSEMNLTIACTVDQAKRDLGYTPLCSLREGMRRSIAWCIETGLEI